MPLVREYIGVCTRYGTWDALRYGYGPQDFDNPYGRFYHLQQDFAPIFPKYHALDEYTLEFRHSANDTYNRANLYAAVKRVGFGDTRVTVIGPNPILLGNKKSVFNTRAFACNDREFRTLGLRVKMFRRRGILAPLKGGLYTSEHLIPAAEALWRS